MKRSHTSDLLMASSVTGISVDKLKEKLNAPNRSFSVGRVSPIKKKLKEDLSKNTIRGQRANMIIYDCAVNCPYLLICREGKECPYDKED